MTRIPLLLTLLGLTACLDDDEVKVLNKGEACVRASAARESDQPFAANRPALISIALSPPGCSTGGDISCSVSLQRDELVINSVARWRDTGQDVCTFIANHLIASCSTPPLAPGSYTVRFGELEESLEVDGATPGPPCLGDESY